MATRALPETDDAIFVRAATPEDVATILTFIRDLAVAAERAGGSGRPVERDQHGVHVQEQRRHLKIASVFSSARSNFLSVSTGIFTWKVPVT